MNSSFSTEHRRSGATQYIRALRFGFTLIELLVVITIIALIAAILFPVFGRARENARRSSCLSNMKQIGLASTQYLQDYDGMFPLQWNSTINNYLSPNTAVPGQRMNFFLQLSSYLHNTQIFACPSGTPFPDSGTNKPNASGNATYVTNGVVLHVWDNATWFQRPLREAVIPESSSTILLQEFAFNTNACIQRPRANSSNTSQYEWWHAAAPFGGATCAENECLSNMHFQGGNLLFCDGHAKWRKFSTIRSGDFGLKPDDPYVASSAGAFQVNNPSQRYTAAF